MNHKYCEQCLFKGVLCEEDCHGRTFTPAMSKSPFIKRCLPRGVYISQDKDNAYMELLRLSQYFREFKAEDENRIGTIVLEVYYKGNNPRKSFAGYGLYWADVGRVSQHFVDVYLKSPYGEAEDFCPHPVSASIKGRRLYIINAVNCWDRAVHEKLKRKGE